MKYIRNNEDGTIGFLDSKINRIQPEDIVISEECYAEFLNLQENGEVLTHNSLIKVFEVVL